MEIKTTDTPPPSAQDGNFCPDQAVGFQIANPLRGVEAIHLVMPDNNFVGATLLDALIRAQFQIKGVKVTEGGWIGFLNECAGMYFVDDWKLGIEAMRAAFATSLIGCLKIQMFRYDPAEMVWRSVPSDAEAIFHIIQNPEIQKLYAERFMFARLKIEEAASAMQSLAQKKQ